MGRLTANRWRGQRPGVMSLCAQSRQSDWTAGLPVNGLLGELECRASRAQPGHHRAWDPGIPTSEPSVSPVYEAKKELRLSQNGDLDGNTVLLSSLWWGATKAWQTVFYSTNSSHILKKLHRHCGLARRLNCFSVEGCTCSFILATLCEPSLLCVLGTRLKRPDKTASFCPRCSCHPPGQMSPIIQPSRWRNGVRELWKGRGHCPWVEDGWERQY